MKMEEQWPNRPYTEDEIRDMVMWRRPSFSYWVKHSPDVVWLVEGDAFVTAERYWEDKLQATVDIRWGNEEIKRLELLALNDKERIQRLESSVRQGDRTLGEAIWWIIIPWLVFFLWVFIPWG